MDCGHDFEIGQLVRYVRIRYSRLTDRRARWIRRVHKRRCERLLQCVFLTHLQILFVFNIGQCECLFQTIAFEIEREDPV